MDASPRILYHMLKDSEEGVSRPSDGWLMGAGEEAQAAIWNLEAWAGQKAKYPPLS